MKQLTILDSDEGQLLATEGLTRAVTKADKDYTDWSSRCWNLFLRWLGKKPVGFKFMIESFRIDALAWGKIEEPQSQRAFGFLSKRSVKMNLITAAGTAKTKSKGSHSTPANVWRKL